MKNWLGTYRAVIANFFTYAVGAVFLRSVTAITALMTLRVLTPAEFGGLALVNTFVGIFPLVLNLGLRQSLFLEYFHLNEEERWYTINHLIILYGFIAVPVLIIAFMHVSLLQKYIFFNSVSIGVIVVAFIYCFLQFFSELYLQVLRYQMRALALTVIQLSAALLTICASIVLVFWFKFKVLGVILANTLGIIFIVACAWYTYTRASIYKKISFVRLSQRARYLFALGLPFVPNILFSWILSSGNRWLLAYLSTMDQGVYALADMAGQAFNLCVLYPLSGSYVPYMLEQYAKKEKPLAQLEQQNMNVMWGAMALMIFLVTLATLCAWWLGPYLLPTSYIHAVRYVWWILLANVFLMGTYFSSCVLVFQKKTWLIVDMNVAAALVQVVVGYLLIPIFGITGAIGAQVCAYGLFFYLNYYVSRKIYVCC